MKNELDILQRGIVELENSSFLTYEHVKKLKNLSGVYMVFDGDEIIYIGSTKNFYVRFGTDLKHKSTHTLNNKLLIEKGNLDEVSEILKKKFRYKVKICNNMLMAESLEHFAIWVYKPRYNKYLYTKNSKNEK